MAKATPSGTAEGALRLGPRDHLLAAALCALAVLVRVPHLGWGLPTLEEEALPMKKAFEMWGWAKGHATLDPATAGWPSLSFYLHLVLQHVHFLVGRATGAFANRYDYYVQFLIDPTQLVVISRLLGVAAAAGVVVVGFRIALRLAGRVPALLVGSLLALSPMLVAHAQQITPDILLAFCSAMACQRLLDVYRHGRNRDYLWAATWIGWGAAVKYTPVLLAAVLYGAHLMRRRREGRPLAAWGVDDARLGFAALACILAFCVTSPYLFANLQVLRRDFAYQAAHMTEGHFGHEGQSPSGHWYYLRRVLLPGLGLPAVAAGIAGLAWAGLRRRGEWAIVGASALVYFLVLGSLSTRFDRYMLPVLLPLALGSAGLCEMLRSVPWAAQRAGRAGAVALALSVVAPAAVLTVRYHRAQALPSTQQLARAYVAERVPVERGYFATELYSVQLPSTAVREELKNSAVYARLDQRQQARLVAMPAYEYTLVPMYSTRAELSGFFYDLRHFEVYDYFITSGAVRGRYEANPNRFPQQVGFYRDLETYAALEASFGTSDRARGPELRIYRLTEDGKRRLLADRGPLQPGWCSAYLQQQGAQRSRNPRHFVTFMESIAGHAFLRERYDLAQLFYQTLLDVSDAAARPAWLFRCAYSHMRNGDLAVAAEQFEEHLRANPRDRQALANLGLTREQQGDVRGARDLYLQLATLAGQSEMGQWARRQLAALDEAPETDVNRPPGSGP